MEFRRIELVLSLILVTALAGRAAAQSSCTPVLMNLAPCLNYITGNSSSPSSTCCVQLSNVVQSSPACLCSVVNGAASSLGIAVNRTLALSLPAACSITTPPLSQCQAAGAPTAPSNPLADSPSDAPEAALGPSASDIPSLGGGSKSVPSTDDGTAVGGGTKASIDAVLFVIFLISCYSTIFTY